MSALTEIRRKILIVSSTMRCINPNSLIRLLVVLILTSISSVGQEPQRSTEEGAELAPTGAIKGRVLDENGQPLPNATVIVRGYGAAAGRTESTDREGRFEASGLDRVAYLVSASLPSYTSLPRDPNNPQPAFYRVGSSVTIVLVKGGIITGTIRRSSGEPVVGVVVCAQMLRDANWQTSRYGAFYRAVTDDRGVYRIYGLPTGTYVVLAGGNTNYFEWNNPYGTDAPTYLPSSTLETAMEINVRAGEEVANADIRYRGDPGHTISGIVRPPETGIGPGFNVTLTSVRDGRSQGSNSMFQPPGSKRFVFYGLGDGDYYVTAQSYSGGHLSASESKRITVRGADVSGIELATKQLGSITGRVILEPSNATDCKGKRQPLFTETLVSAWHNEKAVDKNLPQFLWLQGVTVYPDEHGNISLRNLAPGQYHFIAQFFAKYWYLKSIALRSSMTDAKSVEARKMVDAARHWTTVRTGDRLSGLVITLAEGAASLHGQLTVGEEEMASAKLFVYLVPAEEERSEDVLRFYAEPVSSLGKIAFNNVSPGRYWIVVQSAIDNSSSPITKLRLPDEPAARAKLLGDAKAAGTELELKPCQNVTDYELRLGDTLRFDRSDASDPKSAVVDYLR